MPQDYWQLHQDDEGNPYYYNILTQESYWVEDFVRMKQEEEKSKEKEKISNLRSSMKTSSETIHKDKKKISFAHDSSNNSSNSSFSSSSLTPLSSSSSSTPSVNQSSYEMKKRKFLKSLINYEVLEEGQEEEVLSLLEEASNSLNIEDKEFFKKKKDKSKSSASETSLTPSSSTSSISNNLCSRISKILKFSSENFFLVFTIICIETPLCIFEGFLRIFFLSLYIVILYLLRLISYIQGKRQEEKKKKIMKEDRKLYDKRIRIIFLDIILTFFFMLSLLFRPFGLIPTVYKELIFPHTRNIPNKSLSIMNDEREINEKFEEEDESEEDYEDEDSWNLTPLPTFIGEVDPRRFFTISIIGYGSLAKNSMIIFKEENINNKDNDIELGEVNLRYKKKKENRKDEESIDNEEVGSEEDIFGIIFSNRKLIIANSMDRWTEACIFYPKNSLSELKRFTSGRPGKINNFRLLCES